mmetsp:Transcript_82163/g.164202  ORF Transcript_82163/g.164202 Transcript_82163/m.164202 type:complete len:81 (-) Transcript_82163:110-352(-)
MFEVEHQFRVQSTNQSTLPKLMMMMTTTMILVVMMTVVMVMAAGLEPIWAQKSDLREEVMCVRRAGEVTNCMEKDRQQQK